MNCVLKAEDKFNKKKKEEFEKTSYRVRWNFRC